MKQRYRVFRRGWGTYYVEDIQTKKQESLHTRDKKEAFRLVAARNETDTAPAFSLQLARVYWKAGDASASTRTWQFVMEELLRTKKGETRSRWETAVKDRAFAPLRQLPVVETKAENFLRVLTAGTVSTNVYLRRLHNFALDMAWLPWPVIPKKQWPAVRYQSKRAITHDEHRDIATREGNLERRAFYEMAWHLGASQTDIALLESDNIDWTNRIISYTRKKSGEHASVRFDEAVATVLRSLPAKGPLFPYLRGVRAADRATEFKQRCKGLTISGVTLHSYRYAWAERAKAAGYPERFAQQALGHNSKAVHRAYARHAHVIIPSLGEYEKQAESQRVIPFPGRAIDVVNSEAVATQTP